MMNEAIFLEWRLMTVLSVAAMMACWKANPRGRWRRLRYYEPGAASVLGRNTQQAIYTVGSSGIVQGGWVQDAVSQELARKTTITSQRRFH